MRSKKQSELATESSKQQTYRDSCSDKDFNAVRA